MSSEKWENRHEVRAAAAILGCTHCPRLATVTAERDALIPVSANGGSYSVTGVQMGALMDELKQYAHSDDEEPVDALRRLIAMAVNPRPLTEEEMIPDGQHFEVYKCEEIEE